MKEARIHPVAILEDRYGGCYSRGAWLAVSGADTLENGCYRIIRTPEGGLMATTVTPLFSGAIRQTGLQLGRRQMRPSPICWQN